MALPNRVVIEIQIGQAPETVASPGVEGTVVAGLLYRVEDIAELDEVAAPAPIADIDAGAGHVVDRAVTHRDVLGQLDLHGRRLLLDPAR